MDQARLQIWDVAVCRHANDATGEAFEVRLGVFDIDGVGEGDGQPALAREVVPDGTL